MKIEDKTKKKTQKQSRIEVLLLKGNLCSHMIDNCTFIWGGQINLHYTHAHSIWGGQRGFEPLPIGGRESPGYFTKGLIC